MNRALGTALGLLLLACAAHAQQPASAPAPGTAAGTGAPVATPATRLQQMEEIYQKELSSRHIPLLGRYLVELQRQAAAAVAAADKTAYESEIARVQQIISAGGVVDLIAAQQAQSGGVPMPAPAPVPTERKQALIALSPALAQSLAPAAAANSATAVLGEGAWRIELIAAGTYDVLLHYSCPDLKEPLPVQVEFGGHVVEKVLEPARATKDAQTFRIYRLGSLTLTGDRRGETLRLTAGDKAAPKLILKSLLITKPRPPGN
ncbi:MAG: hypothetical protein ACO1TE_13410 [Prosthecobacter sp.]